MYIYIYICVHNVYIYSGFKCVASFNINCTIVAFAVREESRTERNLYFGKNSTNDVVSECLLKPVHVSVRCDPSVKLRPQLTRITQSVYFAGINTV